MPDVLLFGATGYTGRLTAHALARRGADFAIAGRNRDKLEALAAATGDPAIRVAAVGDVDELKSALSDVGALITCVGPFVELGTTAIEAALQTKTHYVDSSGELPWLLDVFERYGERAHAAGIALVPAFGFDEVPADVAVSIAVAGMTGAEAVLTYAVDTAPAKGTARTLPYVLARPGRFIAEGRAVDVPLGARRRWAPLPPPLGPRPTISGPFGSAAVVPSHLDLETFETYMCLAPMVARVARLTLPLLRAAIQLEPVRRFASAAGARLGGVSEAGRSAPWTLLVEARSTGKWRNVIVRGADVYGLTGELLAYGALELARRGPQATGALAPVAALGLEGLTDELERHGASIEVKESS